MYENLKKKFGQNFLIDKNILNKIEKLIDRENLNILEIGPGDGKLTDKIITKNPSKLTIVEIDKILVNELSKRYSNNRKVKIICKNILDFQISDNYDLIISNLPYNISSQILAKLSTSEKLAEKLILMFQKEFASRLLDEKINSINSLVRCFYDIKLRFHVSRNSFRPVPKIDSSVLQFKKKNKILLKKREIDDFVIFKRGLFSHKRKILKGQLKQYNIDKDFDLNLRVENLNLKTLIDIFRAISI